jgi:hypothetical protein
MHEYLCILFKMCTIFPPKGTYEIPYIALIDGITMGGVSKPDVCVMNVCKKNYTHTTHINHCIIHTTRVVYCQYDTIKYFYFQHVQCLIFRIYSTHKFYAVEILTWREGGLAL